MSEIRMSKWFREFETKYLTVGNLKKAQEQYIVDNNISDITKIQRYSQRQEEISQFIGDLQ